MVMIGVILLVWSCAGALVLMLWHLVKDCSGPFDDNY